MAEVPDLSGIWRLWFDLIMTEISVPRIEQTREPGSRDFRQVIDGSLEMATILDGRGDVEAIPHRSHALRNWLEFLEP